LNENTPSSETSSSLSFHTFDKTGKKQHSVVLSTDAAKDIYDIQEELKYKIVYEPRSDETKALKIEFVDMLDAYGLIPRGLSKNYVLSLLNPSWLNDRQKTLNMRPRVPLFKSFVLRIIRNIIDLRQIFKNRFEKTTSKIFDKNALTHVLFADSATATACSISSGGQGVTIPLFLLPRPRAAAAWSSSFAKTLVGELLSGEGFLAEGAQEGILLGFVGMGLTYAFPGFHTYGFVGYALYAKVDAYLIEFFGPPNQEPVISDENPPSGSQNVPLSLSELSFRISDADGDLMDYSVTTEPNIGTGSGYNKKDGMYTVPISGLEYDKSYSWTVEVTDDKDTTMKQFNFFTESRPPFDPFDEGWQYRKKVTIDHNKVDGDLSDFPVLVSTLDTDLRDKAQNDGDDVLFMDSPGVANKLYHEIEKYVGSSGELVTWVRVPSLSSSVDTVFYMYYGNPSSSSQQIPEKVWDSNYIMVQHMHGSSFHEIDDSTSNNHDVTIESGNPSYKQIGIVGECVFFDGNDYLEIPDHPDFTFATAEVDEPFTVEVWGKYTASGGSYGGLLSKYDDGNGEWSILKENDDKIRMYLRDMGVGYIQRITSSEASLNGDSWEYYTGTYDGTESEYDIHCYIDSTLDDGAVERDSYSGMHDTTDNVEIGRHAVPYYWKGYIDEIRVSDIVRSDAWISTSYNTMNDPSSFLDFGPEE
jgi:hypothetical protein